MHGKIWTCMCVSFSFAQRGGGRVGGRHRTSLQVASASARAPARGGRENSKQMPGSGARKNWSNRGRDLTAGQRLSVWTWERRGEGVDMSGCVCVCERVYEPLSLSLTDSCLLLSSFGPSLGHMSAHTHVRAMAWVARPTMAEERKGETPVCVGGGAGVTREEAHKRSHRKDSRHMPIRTKPVVR